MNKLQLGLNSFIERVRSSSPRMLTPKTARCECENAQKVALSPRPPSCCSPSQSDSSLTSTQRTQMMSKNPRTLETNANSVLSGDEQSHLLSMYREKGTPISNALLLSHLNSQYRSGEFTHKPPPAWQTREEEPKNHPPEKRNISSFKHLSQAKEAHSIIMESEEEADFSIVEGHGFDVLTTSSKDLTSSSFKILKNIKACKSGRVQLAQTQGNNCLFSLKSIYRRANTSELTARFTREVTVLSYLQHPHIIKLYHYFVERDTACLIMQPCLGDNLSNYRQKNGPVPEAQTREWVRQVCLAVSYMHKNDMIHRDLSLQHLLLHENMIKVCGFGRAVYCPLMRKTQCGNPLYASPEVVQGRYYDSKTDVWSLGVLTYELLFNTSPFQIRHPSDMAKIVQEDPFFSGAVSVSGEAMAFMKLCMEKESRKRPTVKELLRHDFLTGGKISKRDNDR